MQEIASTSTYYKHFTHHTCLTEMGILLCRLVAKLGRISTGNLACNTKKNDIKEIKLATRLVDNKMLIYQ